MKAPGNDGSPIPQLSGSVERVIREWKDRSDPGSVVKSGVLPWSADARTRAAAKKLATEARLDIFQDDLQALRSVKQILNRAATARANEAVQTVVFEIRCAAEAARYALLNRAQLEITRHFVAQLEAYDAYRGRVSPEMLDALKERALVEYSNRMNRTSKCDAGLPASTDGKS